MALDDLHIIGLSNNTIWHTIYFADGSCQDSFGNVDGQENNPGDVGQILDVDCATDGADLLHLAAASNTGVWHTYRQASGKGGAWQASFGAVNGQMNNPTAPGTLQQIHTAGGGGMLQLTIDGVNHGPWHTIRYNNSWQGFYGDIHGQVHALQWSSNTACASDTQGNLYVAGPVYGFTGTGSVTLQTAVREASNGSWQMPTTLPPISYLTGQMIKTISLATDGSGNVCAVMTMEDASLPPLYGEYNVAAQDWVSYAYLPPGVQNASDVSVAYMSNGDKVFVLICDTQSPYPVFTQGLCTLRQVKNSITWGEYESVNSQMSNGTQVGPFNKVGASAVKTN